MRDRPLTSAGYARPSIEDYGGLGEFTAGDPSSQHLGFGGTIAVASVVVPSGEVGGAEGVGSTGAGGGDVGGAESVGPAGAGGGDVGGAEGGGSAGAGGGGSSGAGGGDKGLAFTGLPAAALGALGTVVAAGGVALRKVVRRPK